MQKAYISKIMELAEKDKNIIHILSDSGTAYDELFRRNFPDQILNFGISEEHKVAAAAGLATCGKIPFLYTSGAFMAYRAFEFIRNDVCYQNLNVKLVGMGSGLSWSSLGPSHHTTEDIGILNTIPNLNIYAPATPAQVEKCIEKAYNTKGPFYIKTGMSNEKEFFENLMDPNLIKYNILKENGNITVFTSGTILENVYDAISELEKIGYKIRLINLVKIKPFDEFLITDEAEKADTFITIEEHNIHGGIGSIISDIIAKHKLNSKVVKIGLEDKFAEGYGSLSEVRRRNGFDKESLKERIKNICDEYL